MLQVDDALVVAALEQWDFAHLLVQPLDDADQVANIQAAVTFALDNSKWRLTLQAHKTLGLH